MAVNYQDEENPSSADLLYLSGEMVDFSLLVIGACLELPPDVVKEATSQTSESNRDKIHRLLVKWKEANIGKCSWTKLKVCLQGLNNTTLIDSLHTYLKSKQGSKHSLAAHKFIAYRFFNCPARFKSYRWCCCYSNSTQNINSDKCAR